jgi:hypothetical protein
MVLVVPQSGIPQLDCARRSGLLQVAVSPMGLQRTFTQYLLLQLGLVLVQVLLSTYIQIQLLERVLRNQVNRIRRNTQQEEVALQLGQETPTTRRYTKICVPRKVLVLQRQEIAQLVFMSQLGQLYLL